MAKNKKKPLAPLVRHVVVGGGSVAVPLIGFVVQLQTRRVM